MGVLKSHRLPAGHHRLAITLVFDGIERLTPKQRRALRFKMSHVLNFHMDPCEILGQAPGSVYFTSSEEER